jgi:hypothetical protein
MIGPILRAFSTMAVLAALLVLTGANAFAGESAFYLKTGWFTWDETVNGSSFVREEGVMYAAGVTRKDDLGAVNVSELLEVWGGNPDYHGHTLASLAEVNSDTDYLGTREEVALAMNFPAGGAVSLEPSVGIGHKFWVRTRSSEDWNTFYARPGLRGDFMSGDWRFFVKAGALVPFYTRTHVSLTGAGFSDVVTEPETRVSAFAEGGVRAGAFTVGVEYEGMKFGESKKVVTNRVASSGSGVVILANQAYQPATSSSLVSLKVSYSF